MFEHIVMMTEYSNKLPDEWANVADLFVALGDPQRQRIILTFEPGEKLNVSQLVSASKLTRTAVSHHLKILHRAGALGSEKIGKEVFYWIDKEFIKSALQRVIHYVENNT
jgi:DNA-binding transcriptional ArsR family regulator